VRFLEGTVDTGDITVECWSNFFVEDAGGGGVLVHNSKATLTEQAISFSRAARRVQVAVRVGLHHIMDVQYMLRNVDPVKVQYKILLPAMSTVDEQRVWEMNKLKAEIAKIYGVDVKVLTDRFILTHYVGLTQEEADAILKEKADQAQIEADASAALAAQQQAVQQGAPPMEMLWTNWQLRGLRESVRDLSRWSLEQRAWERAADPADGKVVVYLGEARE
jgi:hypothetical protein